MYNNKYIIVLCLLSLFLIKKFYKKHDDYYTHIISDNSCYINKIFNYHQIFNYHNIFESINYNKTFMIKIVSFIILCITYQYKNYNTKDINIDEIMKEKFVCNDKKINEIEKIFDDKILEYKMDLNKKYNSNYNRISKTRNCIKTLKNCLIKYIELNEKK